MINKLALVILGDGQNQRDFSCSWFAHCCFRTPCQAVCHPARKDVEISLDVCMLNNIFDSPDLPPAVYRGWTNC